MVCVHIAQCVFWSEVVPQSACLHYPESGLFSCATERVMVCVAIASVGVVALEVWEWGSFAAECLVSWGSEVWAGELQLAARCLCRCVICGLSEIA